MNFQGAVISGFRNYTNFSTRASRSEFWYWILFAFIGAVVTITLDGVFFDLENISPLYFLFDLIILIPTWAIGARRLHDIDRTGWWQLIGITIIGTLLLIYWFVQPSQAGRNRFG